MGTVKAKKHWLLIAAVAVATVVVAIATQEAVNTHALGWSVAFIFLAVLAAGVTVAVNVRAPEGVQDRNTVELLRRAAREHSLAQLAYGGILNEKIDEAIPIARRGATAVTVACFVSELLDHAPAVQFLIEGNPGSGKSTLLHRVVEAMNSQRGLPAAVVVPLATYDWEHEGFTGWLSGEIAQITGVPAEDIEKLIADQSLFVLLDGIEDVPNDLTLTEQALPSGERAMVDRRRTDNSVTETNPRQMLISNLALLPGFVLTARGSELTNDERAYLSSYPRATIEPIPPERAWEELLAHAPQLRSASVSNAFLATIRSPLYLRLAGRVCGQWSETPDWTADEQVVERWLWDRYLHHRLASRQMREFGWDETRFRYWLARCAAALPPRRQALSLRRWPLLYGPPTRALLRLARSGLSGAIVATFALSFMRPLPAAVCGIACGGGFLLFGEGAATRPLAVQPFTMRRLRHLALRQGWYAFGFVLLGSAAGLLISADPAGALWKPSGVSTTTSVLVGAAAGALLTVVPTLYELFYLDDAALYRNRYRDGAIGATVAAATVIGLLGGAVAAGALFVAFPTAAALWVIPAAVVLALLDTLGLPFAAIGLWALQGRGPLEVGDFLRFAEELRVARRFGQYHFLEHSELQRFLIEEERVDIGARPVSSRLVLAGCGAVAAWLLLYSLLHLVSTLPSTYVAAHWRILWVGFDLGMAALALVTLVGVRRRSRLAALPAAMLAALMLSDGWFDCLTASSSDLPESLVSLLGELAGFAFFLWIAVRLLRTSQEVDQSVAKPAN